MIKRLTQGTVIVLAALAASCSDTGPTQTTPVTPAPSPTVRSVSVTGRTPLIGLAAEAFTATATLSDNTSRDVTRDASWQSSAPSAATVTQQGMVTAIAPGEVEIRASFSGSTGAIRFTIVPASPTTGPEQLLLTNLTPQSGSSLFPTGTPPGAFFPRGSGLFSVGLTLRSNSFWSYAGVNVYLIQAGVGTPCGQNLPDRPTWTPFPAGQDIPLTITGFQIYRLPCEVNAIQVVLHTHQGNSNPYPLPSAEVVLDRTFPATYHLQMP